MSGAPPWEAPEIRVEPDARAHIAENGGHVLLRDSRRHGCCGGTAFVPTAELARPEESEAYTSVEMDGVTVHVAREMAAGDGPLVIGLDAVWSWKRLRVDGAAIRM